MAYEEEPGFHIRIHDIMGTWRPDVSRGVDHFIGYVRFTVTRLDEFEEWSHISEFYVWWTQPTPPYYRHRGRCSSSDGSDGDDGDDGDSEDSERTLTAPIHPIPLEENLESLEELHLWEEEDSKEQKDEENDLRVISSQGSCCKDFFNLSTMA